MTLAERAQLARADEQMEAFDFLPAEEARRRVCICGCGRWWYETRRPGRWRNFATNDCRLKVKRQRERARRAASSEYVAEVLAPVRAKLEGIR